MWFLLLSQLLFLYKNHLRYKNLPHPDRNDQQCNGSIFQNRTFSSGNHTALRLCCHESGIYWLRSSECNFLIILTAVEKVALRFGTPEETWLNDISVEEAKQYMEEGHFAPGSMLPKVQAAVEFAESGEGRTALITLLQKAKDGVNGTTGTRIIKK